MLRTKTVIIAVATTGILGGGALVAAGMTGARGGDIGSGVAALSDIFGSPAPPPSPSTTGPSPEELRKLERVKQIKALDAALTSYAKSAPEFSVAVSDAKTGEVYAFRGKEKYESASIVKVQVLACLLLQAQDDDRALTGTEKDLASRMIRISDNEATISLYSRIGTTRGLNACNKRLGLGDTKADPAWGLTRTTVRDQLKLLDTTIDKDSPLSSASRKLMLDLLGSVQQDQAWGVTAVAKLGEDTYVKNGWLNRETEGNRMIINSVGRVVGGNTDVSIVVLSHNNADMAAGITLTETAAKLTRKHLRY